MLPGHVERGAEALKRVFEVLRPHAAPCLKPNVNHPVLLQKPQGIHSSLEYFPISSSIFSGTLELTSTPVGRHTWTMIKTNSKNKIEQCEDVVSSIFSPSVTPPLAPPRQTSADFCSQHDTKYIHPECVEHNPVLIPSVFG